MSVSFLAMGIEESPLLELFKACTAQIPAIPRGSWTKSSELMAFTSFAIASAVHTYTLLLSLSRCKIVEDGRMLGLLLGWVLLSLVCGAFSVLTPAEVFLVLLPQSLSTYLLFMGFAQQHISDF